MASSIEWTDETWNPVTGCSRVSPGCDNCYMFALYPRLHAMGVPGYEAAPDIVQMLPNRLNAPLTWAKPRRVFVNSMSDLFHKQVTFEFITDVFKVMREANQHIFQVLTKRARPCRRVVGTVRQARIRRMAEERMDRHISREPEVRAAPDGARPHTRRSPFRVRRAAAGAPRPDSVA